jgi:glycosyltransferase involved in cell wall biosynthesis
MKPLKILVISSNLRIGGVERSLIGLLNALPSPQCEVALFLNSHDGEFMDMVPSSVRLLKAIPVYADLDRPIAHVLFSRRPWLAFARIIAKLVTCFRKLIGVGGDLAPRAALYCLPFMPPIPGEYDLALGFLRPHEILLYKSHAKVKAGWIHTDYTKVEIGFDHKFEIKTWSRLDAVVAVSEGVAEAFKKVIPSISNKVCVIENVLSSVIVRTEAAQLNVLSEMPVEAGVTTLCSVGRFAYPKGFDDAIKACVQLRKSGYNIRWYLIGYGPDEESLRQQVVLSGLQDVFVILGKRVNPYPYMAACDIYVQPSRYEGKSVCVREAQILGKTVIITAFPTAASQLENNVDGFITPCGPEGIAAGIAELLDNPAKALRLAQTAKARTYDNLDEVSKIIDLYIDHADV